MTETFLKQAEAKTSTEGKLSEITLKKDVNTDGKNVITGNITIKTGEIEFTTYQVNVQELTKKGTPNPAYQSVATILDTCHSIAEVGEAEASCVAVRSGDLNPYTSFNEAGQKSNRMSYKASFINRVNEDKMEPHSTFKVECYIDSMEYEKDENEQETGRLILHCLLPIYNNGIEPFDIVTPKEYASAMERLFSDPDNASALIGGKIINKNEEIKKVTEMAVGDNIIETSHKRSSELLLTSANPLEEQYSADTIQKAITEYSLVLEERKQKRMNKGNSTTPTGSIGTKSSTNKGWTW